jgi:2-dehydropantoate 2-reductase
VLWEKYLFICAQAGVTAITRCPTGTVLAIAEGRQLYRRLLDELAALAKAAGVSLRPDVADVIMTTAVALPPATTSSLAYDLAQGRRLELEALHGHAVRLGERLGVPTPALFAV